MVAFALVLLLFAPQLLAQQVFAVRCAPCHGQDARGTAQGPGLALNPRVAEQSADQLRAYLQHGNPAAGMPSFADLPAADLVTLAKYLRRINADTIFGPVTAIEPARKITWDAPQPGDWLTYNGSDSANRYSPLKQIDAANVVLAQVEMGLPHPPLRPRDDSPRSRRRALCHRPEPGLRPRRPYRRRALALFPSRQHWTGWRFEAGHQSRRGHPARQGLLRHRQRPPARARPRHRQAALGYSHGARPGEQQPYGGTVAPLIVNDTVIAGVAGADHGIRGFVAAFKPDTGALVWRRWTVPGRGEPGIETWQGKEPVAGGGSTWLTGSYDPSSDTLYWATGNPWPDSDDRDRPGDNLYTNCVLALNAKTGEIKWHYQFTPHDLKDRDATEPNVLVDTVLQRQALQAAAPRRSQRLLLRARPDRWQTASREALPAPRRLG